MRNRISPNLSRAIASTIAPLILLSVSYASSASLLHTFANLARGANPDAGLVADPAGNLYGTTYYGGIHGTGCVYELTRGPNGQWMQTVLHSFLANSSDGAYPMAPLTIDSAGNLYGTTTSGGSAQRGAVFELTPVNGEWKETILYSFSGSPDGQDPIGGLIFDSLGNLYGTTNQGGARNDASCDNWCGVVFKLTPSIGGIWTENVLYQFSGDTGGANPVGNLAFDAAGNLYGAAQWGGIVNENQGCLSGCGAVFRLAPSQGGSWTLTGSFDFVEGITGRSPTGVALDGNGNVFGVAEIGPSGGGVVFGINTTGNAWQEKTLHAFGSGSDGAQPNGGVALDSAGNLYGTTANGGGNSPNCAIGCGTIFQLSEDQNGNWNELILHRFGGAADGAVPVGSVLLDASGSVFTTASYNYLPRSGYLYGNGTVVGLVPAKGGWTFSQLYSFPTTDGAGSESTLVSDAAGNLYGTTLSGGEACYGGPLGCGAVFELMPTEGGGWTRKIIYSFKGPQVAVPSSAVFSDGANPAGGLIFDHAGNLYGMTSAGGSTQCINFAVGCGTVFELSPTGNGGWTETVLYRFQSTLDGDYPLGDLAFDSSGNLYGATLYGGTGTAAGGTAFKLSPAKNGQWVHTIIHNFQTEGDGYSPRGTPIVDAKGNVYGSTASGDDFNGADGGIVYELSPQPNGLWTESILYSFNSYYGDGVGPSSLIFDQEGNLYGTTGSGGIYSGTCEHGCGTFFKLAPPTVNGGSWTESILYQFQGPPNDGQGPTTGVTFDSAGNLYGTTVGGGLSDPQCYNGCGTVFRLKPAQGGTWTEKSLYDFRGARGGLDPSGKLLLGPGGGLFGTMYDGGLGAGTVFEIVP